MIRSWRSCTEEYQDNWESTAHYLQHGVQGAHTSHSHEKVARGQSELCSQLLGEKLQRRWSQSLVHRQEQVTAWHRIFKLDNQMDHSACRAVQQKDRWEHSSRSTAVDPPSMEVFTPECVKPSWPGPDILMLTKVLFQAGSWTRWLQRFLTTSIVRIPL